jgi:uncharacterized protein (DUF2235 family)
MADPKRTLVVCFDGTGNSFNDENTNIIRLFSALDKKKTDKQLCYYQPGIGTYVSQGSSWSPFKQRIAEILDDMFAWYLDAHIMGAYRFLMQTYREGDRICLFGFSRGAYTARCLAGMLQRVGLLPAVNEEQVPFAYKRYVANQKGDDVRAAGFKAAFSREVSIEFIGVWDTVSSVGVQSKHLPFTSSNHIVKTFRHALSLDEHRAKFQPNPWHRSAPSVEAAKQDPDRGSAAPQPPKENVFKKLEHIVGDSLHTKTHKYDHVKDGDRVREEDGDDPEADAVPTGMPTTDVREVWFAGCHADVGGGSVANNTTNTLANPSLKWMINEILDPKKELGIYFKPGAFSEIGAFDTIVTTMSDPTPHSRPPIPSQFLKAATAAAPAPDRRQPTDATMVAAAVPPSPGSSIGAEEIAAAVATMTGEHVVHVQENAPQTDANAPMYDQLKVAKWWWIIELMFLPQRWQSPDGTWHKRWRQNLGAPRVVNAMNPLFHETVRLRTLNGYKPRAKLLTGAKVEYVEQ